MLVSCSCDRGFRVEAVIHGGGQERGLRSGTLNVAGIVGFGVAAEIAAKEVYEKSERMEGLRDRLLDGIRAVAPDVVVNGSLDRRATEQPQYLYPGHRGRNFVAVIGPGRDRLFVGLRVRLGGFGSVACVARDRSAQGAGKRKPAVLLRA